MKAPSITRRLILMLTAGAALLWLLAAIFAIVVLRNEQQQTLDGGLRETAERILPLAIDGMVDDGDRDTDHAVGYGPGPGEGGRGELLVYQVRSADGRVLIRSHDAPQAGFEAPLAEGFTTWNGWRIYTTADARTGLVIQAAESAERREAALWTSAATMILPLVLLVPLGAAGIALAVRRGLAPIRRIGDEVARRDAGNLAPLDIADTPVELRPMMISIDAFLQRLRAAFEAERALAANSAHELRTPIAGSLAQTQRLIEELHGHPAEARARRVEETLHRLGALAAKLLALSRAESGTSRSAVAIDLLPALRLTVEDAAGARGHGATVKLDLPPGVTLMAAIDLDAFGIVMRNLLENAALHGVPGSPIEVAVRPGGIVEVTSAGPVVAPEALAQLAQRFARGNTMAAGSGLGLTIVDTIMRQVGGRLELRSPATGRADGFTARLVFGADAGPTTRS